MPVPIGAFLSKQMYNGRLQSCHDITAKSACKLIDVPEGNEEPHGKSWKVSFVSIPAAVWCTMLTLSRMQNVKEAEAVIHIARQMIAGGKAFKVVTPYDGQRAYIEDQMKKLNLPWEDKVFCVDSFQGERCPLHYAQLSPRTDLH